MSRQDFFSSPYPWLSCLLRHRYLCCDKLDLANLSSFSIYVVTEFSFVVTEFYQLATFIVATKNFFVVTEIFAFNISLCRNMNFFVVIPLVLLFNFYVAIENSLSRHNSPQPHALFVATEIIFVVTEILLLFVMNSECNVATEFFLLRHKFFLELDPC